MPLRINFNAESLAAQVNLASTQNSFFKSVERLSSGLRINRAADDAAGLAVSEKLKNQVRGLQQAQRNAQDGISLVQIADGALSETSNLLARMRELAVESATDTLTNTDRSQIQVEFSQLQAEIDRIASTTQFNKQYLLDSSSFADKTIQLGANTSQAVVICITGAGVSCLGVATNTVSTQATANSAISAIDAAVSQLSTIRGLLGGLQNRFESAVNTLSFAAENTGAANSRIRDADIATETSNLVRTQILQQAATAVLAQANQAPQFALALLR